MKLCYAYYLILESLSGKLHFYDVLYELKGICIDLELFEPRYGDCGMTNYLIQE